MAYWREDFPGSYAGRALQWFRQEPLSSRAQQAVYGYGALHNLSRGNYLTALHYLTNWPKPYRQNRRRIRSGWRRYNTRKRQRYGRIYKRHKTYGRKRIHRGRIHREYKWRGRGGTTGTADRQTVDKNWNPNYRGYDKHGHYHEGYTAPAYKPDRTRWADNEL